MKMNISGPDREISILYNGDDINVFQHMISDAVKSIFKPKTTTKPQWSGPHINTYLHGGPCCDQDGKPIRFETFEEAIKAANENDDCQGITKYPRNGFELRKKPATGESDIRTNAKYAKDASWVKFYD